MIQAIGDVRLPLGHHQHTVGDQSEKAVAGRVIAAVGIHLLSQGDVHVPHAHGRVLGKMKKDLQVPLRMAVIGLPPCPARGLFGLVGVIEHAQQPLGNKRRQQYRGRDPDPLANTSALYVRPQQLPHRVSQGKQAVTQAVQAQQQRQHQK